MLADSYCGMTNVTCDASSSVQQGRFFPVMFLAVYCCVQVVKQVGVHAAQQQQT